ncbi:MAG: penicillin acylase family protein [Bacteroidia bacterium]
MRWIRIVIWISAAILIEIGLGNRWGTIPPLGKFFSPVEGFWRNAEPKDFLPPTEIYIPTLQAPVHVIWDRRWIPHIYAQNEADLYRVQGYLQAYLRLWQMEIQSDAAAGRLSRILGELGIPHDRAMRRLGLPYAAERALQAIQGDSLMRAVIEAFTEGVNAYISQLKPRDYPFEYKLFDYAPEPWSILRSMYLIKYMAYDLSVRSSDKYLTRLLPLLGKGAIDTLYPNLAPFGHTTILTGAKVPEREVPPQPPVYYSSAYVEDSARQSMEGSSVWLGSNNWALSGQKTLTGYPLLANDPHLSLNLPSIWLEMHLNAPTLNVYGVTLLGAPGVIIGYNSAIAWGVTNVGPDAIDFYHVRYADSAQKTFYLAGQVAALHPRPETIWVRKSWGRLEPMIDTVWYTPWGPIVHRSSDRIPRPLAGKAADAPVDCALRWISYEPSNEARCFYELNHAGSLDDYKCALEHFGSPAQNFIYADTAGHIALWVRGYYPLRWRDQGKFILDAERPEHHWRDWLSFEENPHTIDPPEGFVRSANSYPAGSAYPYYLGWYFALPDRSARIEARLRQMERATVDSLRMLQLDVENFLAQKALPILLEYIKSHPSRWVDTLRRWDGAFRAQSRAATIFRQWWKAYHALLWQRVRTRMPEWEITLKLTLDVHSARTAGKPSPHPRWLSTADTGEKSLSQLIRRSWEATVRWADQAGDTLIWWRYRGTQLRHLARLPGFGSHILQVDGDPQCINAIGPTAGPSWRMVVSLKPPVQGYGIYPGGQSGNPGSHHYMDFLPDWEKGILRPHAFFPKQEAFPDSLIVQRTIAFGGKKA